MYVTYVYTGTCFNITQRKQIIQVQIDFKNVI